MTRPPNKRVSRGQPIRRGAPAKPASGCKGPVKMAGAVIAVGLVLLVFHFFAPVLLLAALPTREWRKAAMS